MAAVNCLSSSAYGFLMPRSGFGRHQVHRGVGDVDRRVICRDRALRRGVRLPHDAPRVGSGCERFGVVQQQVRATTVRDAVGLAVLGVPGLVLQAFEDVGVVRDQVPCSPATTSPPAMSRSVASPEADTTSYSPVFISCTISSLVAPELHVDGAARLLLQLGDPVDLWVGATLLDVAGPGDDVDLCPRPCRARSRPLLQPSTLLLLIRRRSHMLRGTVPPSRRAARTSVAFMLPPLEGDIGDPGRNHPDTLAPGTGACRSLGESLPAFCHRSCEPALDGRHRGTRPR